VETRAYRPAAILGQEGREDGRFRQPGGVVVDPAGWVYVADTYNHRIQVFAADGRYRRAFGREGTELGELSRPRGLAWGATQLLYVADTGNHRVQAFDQRGRAVLILGGFGTGPGQFNAPEGVAVDPDGTLYVADTLNHRVQKFTADGRFLRSWGESGSGKGEFLGPSAIAIDRDGRVWVADTHNHRVQAFSADGQYLWEIGRAGRGVAEFDSPRGIATDAEGQLYVADTGNGRVQIFARDGGFVAQVGHLGRRPGEFYYPAGLWVDAHRTLYVADTINHRVQILSYWPAVARAEQGWQAFQAARLEQALTAWTEALSLDPTMAEAFYGAGLVYARRGDLDRAVDHLKAALVLQPGYREARWALYRVYLGKLTWPLTAAALLASAVGGAILTRRLRRRMLRERARRYLEEGRIDETIATYERLLQFDRDDLEVCKTLESLYEQEGLESKRKQVNEIIARLEPDNLQALSYLGKQQFAERRFAEAHATWERVLQQDAACAEAHFYLGAVQAERGDAEAASLSLQRALSQAIKAYQPSPGERASDLGQAAEAYLTAIVEAWERVLAQEPPYERAQACFREARRALAERYVEQGRAALHHHDAQDAIVQLRWVGALEPTDAAARELFKRAQTSVTFDQGLRYYQAQDYLQALRCFRETLALDPEHDKAKRYLRYAQQCFEGGVSERFRHLDLGDREKS
jgi:sugar lactone lactonase YvrE/Tfp pilus assembly protein PilF